MTIWKINRVILSLAIACFSFFPSLIAQSLGQVIVLEDSLKTDSWQSILYTLRGKPIFVDLWATWCGPCREQMRHRENVEAIARQFDVQLLYISFDDADRYLVWWDYIHDLPVVGYHVLGRESLLNELRTRFADDFVDGKPALFIPHYVLVDADGRILTDSAPGPDRKGRLRRLFRRHFTSG